MSDPERFCVGPPADPDRYTLGQPVGAGAEGILYRASVSVSSGATLDVAVKMLHPHHHGRLQEWAMRWSDQVELLRSLQVPGVVPVRDGFIGPLPHPAGAATGTIEQTLYLIMNWVDGKPLDAWADEHPDLGPADRLRALLPVAAALDLMHSGQATGGTPVIHGDIKPSNVLVTSSGESVLVDFGLVRLLPEGQRVTGVSGTPGYLAPEVRAEGSYTPSADRYAFGGVAYFLLTGDEPPRDGNPALLGARLGVAHPYLPELVEHVASVLDPDPLRRPRALANWCAQLRNSSLEIDANPEVLPPVAPMRLPVPGTRGHSATSRNQRAKPRMRPFRIAAGLIALACAAVIVQSLRSGDQPPATPTGETHEASRTSDRLLPSESEGSARAPVTTATPPAGSGETSVLSDGDPCQNSYVGYKLSPTASLVGVPSSDLVATCEAFTFDGTAPRPAPAADGGFIDDPVAVVSLEGTISSVLLRAEVPAVAATTQVAGHLAVIVEEQVGQERIDTYLVETGRFVLALQLRARPGDALAYGSARAALDSLVATLLLSDERCHNNTDARCGAFYYEADPAPNQKLVIDKSVTPANPRVGEVVRFEITVQDADADILENTFFAFGDGPAVAANVILPNTDGCSKLCNLVRTRQPSSSLATGGWAPPPQLAGTRTFIFEHAYQSVGDFAAQFDFRSTNSAAPPGRVDPYQSTGTITIPVEVR